jgi:hypothetical protein
MKAADYARMAEVCSRQADVMPPSPERDALIEKARQYRSLDASTAAILCSADAKVRGRFCAKQ